MINTLWRLLVLLDFNPISQSATSECEKCIRSWRTSCRCPPHFLIDQSRFSGGTCVLVFASLHPQHLGLHKTRHLNPALLTCKLPSSQHFALPYPTSLPLTVHLRPCGHHPPMGCSTSESSTHGSALRLHEACQILQDSTTAKDILLVCSYFPFPHSGIPLDILSSRRTENSLTDVDVLGLCKAEETLRRIATEYNSCSWNWQWSPPFASSAMGPTRVANDTDEALSTFASKVTFMALEREACALSSKAVDDILAGLAHSRRLLESG
ncbi:hypothetical protein BKA65DRAFT_14138 [Rhexocercosporidium sp. MPI-PUGE-AT-0058]|nr:hypothetical protein BKA65DRAFT_14138 [Rhexocercosporidium sp. MPI-PUGE-AT-0058]